MSDHKLAEAQRDAQEQPFEDWWEREGQFARSGGGQYEKTFAWNAWCAAIAAHEAEQQAGGELARERSARQAAQIELERYKALLARSRIDLMRELREQGWRNPGEQQAGEAVMVYHGRCTIDCGDNGHHNVELLKLIPAGTKLYTRPLEPLTQTKLIALWADKSDGPSNAEIVSFARAIERAHGITKEPKT